MGTCRDTPSLLGNHFTFCKTMNKMTFLPMLLLLSVSLSVAIKEEGCGPDHCEINCGSGEICKDKKMVCEATPSLMIQAKLSTMTNQEKPKTLQEEGPTLLV